MAIINPFDFERIFVSILAGDKNIFTALVILFLSGLGGYFHMDGWIMIIMYIIAAIIMSMYIEEAFYILIILIIGIVVFYLISRMFNR